MSVKSVNRIENNNFWKIPLAIIIAIYLPAAIVGVFRHQDKYSIEVLASIALFSTIYYYATPKLGVRIIRLYDHAALVSLRELLNLRLLAWFSVALYGATIIFAALTTRHIPLFAALLGADELKLAAYRADYLATRPGIEILLRYSALILGKNVMPYYVLILFVQGKKWWRFALFLLTLILMMPLEKSGVVFAFLPLIMFNFLRKRFSESVYLVGLVLLLISFLSLLASGGLKSERWRSTDSDPPRHAADSVDRVWPVQFKAGGTFEDATRVSPVIIYMRDSESLVVQKLNKIPLLSFLINRVFWIPYITAYDWLRFQDQALGGQLTLGQQINGVCWLLGKQRLPLEAMVYEFQLGVPEGGSGAANVLFLIDAKLAFGWAGVVFYSFIFSIFSAIIFTCRCDLVKISSVTSFYTAAVSPLFATLLSGGLCFFLFLAIASKSKFSLKDSVL